MNFNDMLIQARAGKRVRKGATGTFVSANTLTFSYDDTQYTGWEVETEVPRNITLSALSAAWDASVPRSGSVALSAESAMFKRIANQLGFQV